MGDPLEQFDVGCKSCLYSTKFLLFFLILVFLITLLEKFSKVSVSFQKQNTLLFIFSLVFAFVVGLLRENLKLKHSFFLPNILYLFCVVFISNILGMIPYAFTTTSAFIFTFFLSFQYFLGLTFFGVLIHKAKSLLFFLPQGVPLIISPFLSVIELISYIARPFSLGIRLFANIMAGHSLLKILIGFVWEILLSKFMLFAVVPAGVVFAVTGLEFMIAGLQAYVFTILVIVYLSDAIFLSH